MVEAKLLRKKLKNGLIVDKWDLVTIIEKQQAEIEALKQIIDANNLNQNIGQFVKPNNEPVAWISRLPEGDVYNCAWAEKQNDDDIPLYTHPVKEQDEPNWKEMYWQMHELNHKHWAELKTHPAELTDEEIIDIWLPFVIDGIKGKIEFARAILRKASEK